MSHRRAPSLLGARRAPALVVGALVVALALVAGGCVGTSPAGQELDGKADRRAPNREFLNGTVAASNAFAIDLYRGAATARGNFAYSPFAVLKGLAMARTGSAGQTRAQFDTALHANLTPDLDSGINTVEARLSDLAGEKRSETRKGRITIDLGASLWGQRGTHIKDDFLDRLAANYGSGFRVTDFSADPEVSRSAINRWAAEQTEERIEELVPRGGVTAYTRFVVASVSSIQAPWAHPFDLEQTRPDTFTRLDGSTSDARMMQLTADAGLRYAEGNGWQAVEVPYLGDQLTLLLVLPGTGEFATYEQSLSTERLRDTVAALAPRPLDLRLPTFGFTTGGSLRDQLGAQGLAGAFGRDVDFSGITTDELLSISDAVDQGFFGVSEDGSDPTNTATAKPDDGASLAGARKVAFDRPFLFFVRDRDTGLVLIEGRVVAP